MWRQIAVTISDLWWTENYYFVLWKWKHRLVHSDCHNFRPLPFYDSVGKRWTRARVFISSEKTARPGKCQILIGSSGEVQTWWTGRGMNAHLTSSVLFLVKIQFESYCVWHLGLRIPTFRGVTMSWKRSDFIWHNPRFSVFWGERIDSFPCILLGCLRRNISLI